LKVWLNTDFSEFLPRAPLPGEVACQMMASSRCRVSMQRWCVCV
jgi:hypothetical protein